MSEFTARATRLIVPEPEHPVQLGGGSDGRRRLQQNQLAMQGQQMRSDRGGPRAGRASCGWAAEHQRPGGARAGVCAGGRGAAVAGPGEVRAPDAAGRTVAADAGQPEPAGSRTSTRWASQTPAVTTRSPHRAAPSPGQPGYGASGWRLARATTARRRNRAGWLQQRHRSPRRPHQARHGRRHGNERLAEPCTKAVANPRTGRGDKGNTAGPGIFSGRGRASRHTSQRPVMRQTRAPTRSSNSTSLLRRSRTAPTDGCCEDRGGAPGPAAKAAASLAVLSAAQGHPGEMQRRSATALQLQQQIGGGATTAAAAPTAAQQGARADAGRWPPRGTHGATRVHSGAPSGYTAASEPPAAPARRAATARASGARPRSHGTPPTGADSPQSRQALDLNAPADGARDARSRTASRQGQAAGLRAQAALYMQADSVSVDPATGIQTTAAHRRADDSSEAELR